MTTYFKTHEISLTQKEFFMLLVKNKFVSKWWSYAFPLFTAVVFYFLGLNIAFVKFLLVFGFIYPIWVLIYLSQYARSDRNYPLRESRWYEFDDEKVTAHMANGDDGEFAITELSMVKENNLEWLIYFVGGNYLYVPKTAIDPNRIVEFSEWLRSKVKRYSK